MQLHVSLLGPDFTNLLILWLFYVSILNISFNIMKLSQKFIFTMVTERRTDF